MGDVVHLDVVTTLDLPPERVLDAARANDLASVIVVGRQQDGSLYFAGSSSDGPMVLWDLERAKQRIMELAQDVDGPVAPHAA